MLFRQIIHEDLGCASYLVGDRDAGVAAVVDPQWDIDPYLRLSRLHGVRIEHVLETHNHADHVSGHGRLARATGATIHIHELAEAEYPHEPFADGWKLELGDGRDRGDPHARATGPSTPRFLLRDAGRGGDALGGADRRLAVRRRRRPPRPRDRAARGRRATSSARCTSACSRCPTRSRSGPATSAARSAAAPAIDLKTSSTIGFERAPQPRPCSSPTRRSSSRTRSARSATGRRTSSASSRSTAARWSRSSGRPRRCTPRAVEVAIAEGAVLVDARTNEQFDEAHIPGAISASAYDTGFATKVAQVVPADAELIVVAASDGYELRGGRAAGLGRPARCAASSRAG